MRSRKTNKKGNTEALERQLSSLERNLLKAFHERLEKIRTGSAYRPAEFLDIVSNSELDELTARIAESDSMKIDEIEAALERLRNGQYGICSGCGDCISKKRLKARPFATLCIDCKQEFEKESLRQADGGGHYSRYGVREDVVYGGGGNSGGEFHSTVRGNKL